MLLLVKLQAKNPATLLKVTLLHECFSRYLNCANCTTSRKTLHIYTAKNANKLAKQCKTKQQKINLDSNQQKQTSPAKLHINALNILVLFHFCAKFDVFENSLLQVQSSEISAVSWKHSQGEHFGLKVCSGAFPLKRYSNSKTIDINGIFQRKFWGEFRCIFAKIQNK